MPPPALLNLDALDCDRVVYTREQIYERLPQRYEFAQLDAIIHLDPETGTAAGYRDVRADEWWCRGHLPEKPIFPGILMIETAAQLAGFVREILIPDDQFMAFGGVDDAKFRGTVLPPARLLLAGRALEARKRRLIWAVQAYVDGAMVFEGTIIGMPIRL